MALSENIHDVKALSDPDKKYHYIVSSDAPEQAATVKLLLHYIEPISIDEGCIEVLNRFIENGALFTLAIVDNSNGPVGLIDRGRLTEIFVKPFARDLYHKKLIGEIMDTEPIIVDIHTSIDDLAKIIIDSGMRHMVNGFIIVQNGVYAGMVTGHALLEEITPRKQRELYFLAHYDQLTGLPNRQLFKDRLLQSCQNTNRTAKTFALIFVDLDRFKFINDSMGHSVGDLLLITFAQKLTACVRKNDTVARLGGDEFVIILQNLHGSEDAQKVTASIIEQIRQPMKIYNREIQITASLGLALYPQHDETTEGLIRKADAAMYEVKQQGRNNYLIYSDAFDQGMAERMCLETLLRTALDNHEFSLFYQPQIHLASNKVIGVEALLRWHSPELGLVSPAKFIPVAEETGLIIAIGDWVLREACRQHSLWLQQGLPPLRVAINISPIQFRQKEFGAFIKEVIDDTGIDPQYLELELTENLVMTNTKHTVETLIELRALGIKLAIDDFGTGYSSLSYLRNFPIDRLKIDQSFIRNIKTIPANEAIVRAVISMGDNLGLEMIAEGIETLAELECIKSHHCQEVQGFHFSKPVPAGEFEHWYQQFGMI
ncbi:MAG: putative bifunctional diguanylate cyclase/phosphodiesterase [Methylobacter sp.]